MRKIVTKYEKLRQEIISCLKDYFIKKDYVCAGWLGWSDANNENDDYSDIDFFVCVDDNKINSIFEETRILLQEIGLLDYISAISDNWNKKWQTYHIVWTPASLHIEIWVIKKSVWMTFEEWHPAFKPKIIFDKENIIKFEPINKEKYIKWIQESLQEQKDLMGQYARVEKYIQRGNYIETTNYFIRFIFMPLVEVLRIYHTPLLYDWWRIHISRHLPKDIIVELEQLMKFNSLEDLDNNLKIGQKWFRETIDKIENKNNYL